MENDEAVKLTIKYTQRGIATGLRMAAEILRDHPWKINDDRTNIYRLIIAKAKEVDEAKGEN